jgi:Leucine-rich repeat (LRR) protein
MFTGLSSLTKLVITGFKQLTRIISIPAATLEHIELSDNCIYMIETDAFRLLSKLTHLNLDKTFLSAEQAFPAFAYLTSLEQLSLRTNMIYSLEGLKSIYLPRLRVLNLCVGQVTKLSKQTFATLPGLCELIVSYNQIMEIEQGAFDGMVNLRSLDLHDNPLQVFFFNVFESAANKLGPPINLLDLNLDRKSLSENLVQWSPETMEIVDESMPKAKKIDKHEMDAAVWLFAKCGFRNKLHVSEIYNYNQSKKIIIKWPFLKELERRDFVRISWV